ncbi:cupin domain-containing protein [Bosea sp. 2YAB26]|jgi:mannose-6-phosphate isomerase-like protein (cupin superfamily)|uniref:cupin domain-containing protein n=1 Tax=unclassified Bosea (in: a-proteobacteria) TaxID=2653178 RepID=UPI003F8DB2CF
MTEIHEPGETFVIQPGQATSYWQPVPANGHIEVVVDPARVRMDHPLALGTQTVPPGGYVREHSHDRHEEVIYFIKGKGRAVLDGKDVPLQPGTAIFVGKSRRHMFINEGTEDLHWVWLIVPNGLEDFFRLIGRSRVAGEAAPANFPRPDNVLEIERQTVFAVPPTDQRNP